MLTILQLGLCVYIREAYTVRAVHHILLHLAEVTLSHSIYDEIVTRQPIQFLLSFCRI